MSNNSSLRQTTMSTQNVMELVVQDDYSYAAFVDYHKEKKKSRPHRPNNPDNFILQQDQPGHETNRFTNRLSILNEFWDNDIRAASDAGMSCEITLNIYKEEKFGKNILRTYAAGPGHGQENAVRFCQRGDVDLKLASQLKLGASWYGNGQKDAMQEISCYSIAVSVSKAPRPDTWDVHVHVFQFLGYNRVHTLHYEYYCTDGVWTLNLRNKNDLQCFLETSAPTFLKTEDNIKTLIREESPNAETGVTRLMLGLRGFEELLVDRRKIYALVTSIKKIDRRKIYALVTSIKKTHVRKKNITYNIFGVEFQPNTSLEDNIVTEKKFEFENFTLKLGKRRVPSPKAKEPQDAILEGPIFVLGNRIMQFDYNSFYKSKYDDEDPGAVALFYYRKYVNDARNNHGAIVKQFRLYTDLVAIIDLKNAGICSTTTRVKPKAGRQILNDINEPIRGYVRDLPEPENLKLYNLYKTRTAAGSSSSSGSSSSGSSGSSGSSSSGNSSSGSSGSNSSVSSGSNSSVSSGSHSSGNSSSVSSGSNSSVSSGSNSSVSSGSHSSGNSSSVSSGSNSSVSSGSNSSVSSGSHSSGNSSSGSSGSNSSVSSGSNSSVSSGSHSSGNSSSVSSGSNSSVSSGSHSSGNSSKKRKKKRKTPSNKKQRVFKKKPPIVSEESFGFLYCYTLENSSDWKDIHGKTIYKWGLTKDKSLENYIRHFHGCKHPTKRIRHVCSWSHVPLVKNVEKYVLCQMQNSTVVTRFATPSTRDSEYFTTGLDEPTLCVWLEEMISDCLQREMQTKEAELSTWQVVPCYGNFCY